jgi:uncharacterized membrane protein
MEPFFEQIIHVVTSLIEGLGVLVVVAGIGLAGVKVVQSPPHGTTRFSRIKSTLGRSILLGLELMVAADIVNTVAIDPSLESLAVLAGVIVIRTILSLSLEVEIEGRWPWRRNPVDEVRMDY